MKQNKQQYEKLAMRVVELHHRSTLLQSSPEMRGVRSSRNSYSGTDEQTWE